MKQGKCGGCGGCRKTEQRGTQPAEKGENTPAGGGSPGCGGCTGCGAGGGGCGGCCAGGGREIVITEGERDLLLLLGQSPFLPLARLATSPGEGQPETAATEPLFLQARDDGPDTVRKTGESLRALEQKRLITLDYDMPLQNGDYSVFESSDVIRRLSTAGGGPPVLEYGSIALTALGRAALDSLDGLL